MIQLRKMRFKGDTKYDSPLEPPIIAESVQKLFLNLDKAIAAIPEVERWNIFYTLGGTSGDPKRDWFSQDVIPFDIDNVVDADGHFEEELYLSTICDGLGVDRAKCAIVASGNGIQLLVQIKNTMKDKAFFDEQTGPYQRICEQLQKDLTAKGLKGYVDPSSFASNRIFRLPGTWNRKPDRKDRMARVINATLAPQDFPICPPKSKKDKIKDADQVTDKEMKFFAIDTPTVESGCNFLKWARESPTDLNEPQWYAMLSIVGRLEDGRQKAHAYSVGHPSYNERDVDRKLDQAVAASGPRTCDNIDQLWGKCSECPNFKKVPSPISIKGETFIATEKSGFYLLSKTGALRPQFEDLRRFFSREHPYKCHEKSGLIYVWDKSRYINWSQTQLRNYAHEHFLPKPAEAAASEFVQWVNRTNLIQHDWFPNSTRGFINFDNGVLESATGVLHPHSPERGFLYVLPYGYDADAACPTFNSFMQEVTCHDDTLARLLLEFMGYAICDQDYWLQKALLLIGEGSNGKSTFLQIMEEVAGRENVSFLSLADLQQETSRSHLEGRLLNVSDELPNYHFKNTELLKKLLGGSMTARRLYHDGVMMQNRTKFAFAGNDIPDSSDASEGFFRRLAIAPFNAHFETSGQKGKKAADTSLLRKMRKELPGIFNAILRHYTDLKVRGHLIEAGASQKEGKRYREGTDRVGTWIKENLHWNGRVDDEAPKVEVSIVFERYVSDSKRSEEKAISKYHFTKHLRRQLDRFDERYTRKQEKNDRQYILKGVSIRDGAPDAHF